MLTFIWSVLGFIVTMGIIVTIHEWGHYQVAKWFNFKIIRFSVGFGKPIWRKQGQETEFVIGAFPLGGYVKFADEREAPVADCDVHRAFNRQSVYKRMAVVIAGPAVNLIFAWLAFTLMFVIGVTGLKPMVNLSNSNNLIGHHKQPAFDDMGNSLWQVSHVNQKAVYTWKGVHQQVLQALTSDDKTIEMTFTDSINQRSFVKSFSMSVLDINDPKQNWLSLLEIEAAKPKIPAVLGRVLEDSPAAQGGLQSFDKILQINDFKVNNWQDFVKVVQSNPGAQVMVHYERNQAQYTTLVQLQSVALSANKRVGKMGVGVYVDEEVLKPFQSRIEYGFAEASIQAYERSLELIDMSLIMLKRMLLGEVSTENLSGPISIAQFSGQALQSGLITFLSLLGILSLSIGILNLLPVPMLDGGHLLFYIIEAIKGSPVGEQTMQIGQVLGLMAIVGLTLLALSNDILRIFHG